MGEHQAADSVLPQNPPELFCARMGDSDLSLLSAWRRGQMAEVVSLGKLCCGELFHVRSAWVLLSCQHPPGLSKICPVYENKTQAVTLCHLVASAK